MKKGYIFLFMILLLPFNVYALTGSISINCGSNTVKKGDTITCNVTGTSDAVVTGFEATLSITGSASAVSFTKASDLWHDCSISSDKTTISGYAEGSDINGNFSIGALTLKIADAANGNIIVNFNNVGFSDENFHDVKTGISTNGVTLNVEAATANIDNSATTTDNGSATNDNVSDTSNNETKPNPNATLKEDSKIFLTDLTIENYEINFDKDKLNYTLQINDEESLNITPVLNDDSIGSYSIVGNRNLANGSIISIVLTSNDNEEKVIYTLTVNKENDTATDEPVAISSGNNNNITKIIFLVIIGLLVIINIARILSNRRKNSN